MKQQLWVKHRRIKISANMDYILEKNLTKVDWWNLSSNPNAIHILEKNLDKVDWKELSANPSIFQIDYERLKENRKVNIKEAILFKLSVYGKV